MTQAQFLFLLGVVACFVSAACTFWWIFVWPAYILVVFGLIALGIWLAKRSENEALGR